MSAPRRAPGAEQPPTRVRTRPVNPDRISRLGFPAQVAQAVTDAVVEAALDRAVADNNPGDVASGTASVSGSRLH